MLGIGLEEELLSELDAPLNWSGVVSASGGRRKKCVECLLPDVAGRPQYEYQICTLTLVEWGEIKMTECLPPLKIPHSESRGLPFLVSLGENHLSGRRLSSVKVTPDRHG